MKDKPLVSIIINNYNYDQFLRTTIDSALSQTYPLTEVIVVDDGSTDNSREQIASYENKIVPVLKENGGQASAFNAGFAVSKGEIILFLDSDDYLFPYAAEQITKVWHPDSSKVHYMLQAVDASGESLNFLHPSGQLASGEVWQLLLRDGIYTTPPTSGNAFTRRALDKIFPIPEDEFPKIESGPETYMQVQVPFFGDVVAIEEPLGAYRIHGGNKGALSGAVDGRWVRRLVEHDLMQQRLLRCRAAELGHKVPSDLERRHIAYLWSRLASLRLDPQNHPIPSDQAMTLMVWALRILARQVGSNLKRSCVFSLWFVWVGIMPLPLAKPAVSWLFSPQTRPNFLKTIRSLVNA